MSNYAIITAGGVGKRMGAGFPKQFLEIGGKSILFHCLDRYHAASKIDKIILTTPPDYVDELEEKVLQAKYNKVERVVAGGEKRQDSVWNGINAISAGCEVVAIQDGVRPFIKPEVINRSVDMARKSGACIVAAPITDTIKQVAGDKMIEKTIDRSQLYGAQTPQTFRFELIKKVMGDAMSEKFYGTDEASLFEHFGLPVEIVLGDRFNIKITQPEDMILAEAIAKEYGI